MPQLSADPTPLIFNYVLGAGQGPAPQVLTVSGSVPIQFSITTPAAAFVSLSTTSGITSGSITVRIDASGLIEGRYDTSLTISAPAANSPLTVPIVLYVTTTPPAFLTAAPTLLTFDYVIGGVSPQPRAVSVSGSSLNFTAASSASWAAVAPSSGTTPASLQVSVAPGGLIPGIYFATVTLDSASAINSPHRLSSFSMFINFRRDCPSAQAHYVSITFWAPHSSRRIKRSWSLQQIHQALPFRPRPRG